VLTIFHNGEGESDTRVECFARLYRKNQSLDISGHNALSRYTSPGEWVIVHSSNELYLEECATPPSVERNREGWRCSAIQDVKIRSGPSFRAYPTGKVIRADEEFLVSEKVRGYGENVLWFRLKNDEGWVNSTENGDPVVHCHILDYSRKVVRQIIHRPQNVT
jgi:hypothetical protein